MPQLNVGAPVTLDVARALAHQVARGPIGLPNITATVGEGFPSAGRERLIAIVNAQAAVARANPEEAARHILENATAGPPAFPWSQAMPAGLTRATFTLYGDTTSRSGCNDPNRGSQTTTVTLHTVGTSAWVETGNVRAPVDKDGCFGGRYTDGSGGFTGRIVGTTLTLNSRSDIPASRMSNGVGVSSEMNVSGPAGGPGYTAQNKRVDALAVVGKFGIPAEIDGTGGHHVHRRGGGQLQGIAGTGKNYQGKPGIAALRDGDTQAIVVMDAIATAWKTSFTAEGVGAIGYPRGELRFAGEGADYAQVQLFERGFITSKGERVESADPEAAFRSRFPTWKPPMTEAQRNAQFRQQQHEAYLSNLMAPHRAQWPAHAQLIATGQLVAISEHKFLSGRIDQMARSRSVSDHVIAELRALVDATASRTPPAVKRRF